MTPGRFFRTPKGVLLIVLTLLTALGAADAGVSLTMPVLIAAALAASLLDGLILRGKKGKWVFPSGALLTGLLVGMILSPREPWWVAVATSVIAIVSKYVVRGRTANVFNPAALALVIAFYLLDTSQSWWGALPDAHPAALLIVIVLGGYVVVQNNKIPVVLSFLGAHFLLFTAAAFLRDPEPIAQIFRTPDLHAAVFFALFMVTDPPTSPPKHRDQLVYGVITAVFSYAAFALIGAVYFLLAGLLMANVWEGWRRRQAKGSGAGARRGLQQSEPVPV